MYYQTHKLDFVRGSRIAWLEKELKRVEKERDHYRTLYLNRRAWEESQRRRECPAE